MSLVTVEDLIKRRINLTDSEATKISKVMGKITFYSKYQSIHIYLTQEHKLQCFNTSCTHFSGNPVGRPACCFWIVVYFHVFSPLSGLLWRNCDGWSFCSEIYWCNGSPGKTSFLTWVTTFFSLWCRLSRNTISKLTFRTQSFLWVLHCQHNTQSPSAEWVSKWV